MAALLGADLVKAQAIADAAAEGEVCTVANDNDPTQVVISGARGAIERAIEIAKEHGAKRALLLPVSAPFHCPMMQPAADAMAKALADVRDQAPLVPVYRQCNRSAGQRSGDDPDPAGRAGDGDGALARIGAGDGRGGGDRLHRAGRQGARRHGQADCPDAGVISVVTMDDIEALAKVL
jgi:[acyl-carrier-protein] S-malonyltransferase